MIFKQFAETVGKILGKKPIFEQTDRRRGFGLIVDIPHLLEPVKPSFTYFEEVITLTLTLQ